MSRLPRQSGDVDEADDGTSSGSRQRQLYVRFDSQHQRQSGPMYGPYESLDVSDGVLSGTKPSGTVEIIAEQLRLTWVLRDRTEPPYRGYSVLFS